MSDEITRVVPIKGLRKINLSELWQFRELLGVLIEKEIKVRYKQTLIGVMWAILQPVLTMMVFTVFFGRFTNAFSGEVPYPFFAYSGLILWSYFSAGLTATSNSLIDNSLLISKVYLPKLLIPLAASLTPGVDYLVTATVLFGLAVYYQIPIRLTWLLIPGAWGVTWILTAGLGFWLGGLNVKYRDVRYALPFFIQLLIFASPVIYPLETVGKYRLLIQLNPISGLIELQRNLLLGGVVDWELVVYSTIVSLIIFGTGLIYFKSVERYFADKI
ncbi:MAG: ABC transporter permease [Patescibacteria group bacterium]|nr:ABC transporter permease [Patescibacteria group bacterium]